MLNVDKIWQSCGNMERQSSFGKEQGPLGDLRLIKARPMPL